MEVLPVPVRTDNYAYLLIDRAHGASVSASLLDSLSLTITWAL